MRKIIYSFLSFSLLFPVIGTNVYAISKPVAKEDVIIMFKKKSDAKVVQKSGGVIDDKYKNIPAISASVPVTQISALKKNPNVAYVEIDKPVRPSSQTEDWGIASTISNISHTNGFTGKAVKVAVLDTGVKVTHPDILLSGGYDPNGSTYDDYFGHGTHVAGIIGAKNNDIGVEGVAPDSQVYAVKVMNNSDGTGSVSDIIQGIDWSISNHMNIINMSLGSNTYSQAFQDAVNRAHDAGIFVVAAAGNDGNASGIGDTVDYPAKFDNVIAVGAVDNQNQKASFSSAGPAVDFVAPGVNILSTYYNGSYVTMSGTSMATPYVAGILALYKEAYPTYTNDQILTLMEANAKDLGDPGKDNLYGYGLAQAPTQGDSSIPNVPVPNMPPNFQATDVFSNSINLKWDADSNAKIYDLRRNGVLVYSGTLSNFTDKNLLANTSYQYTLIAKNVAGNSSPASLTITTKGVLMTPYLYYSKTTTGYKMYWSSVTGATYYNLYRNDSTILNDPDQLIYSGSNLSFLHEFQYFSPGVTYTYTLIAENANASSKPVKLTFTTPPDFVTGLDVTNNSNTVSASWNAMPGATFYQVKLNGKVIYKGSATQMTYSGLLSNTSYKLVVESGNIGGLSGDVIWSFVTPQTVPNAPLTLTVTGTGTNTSSTLKWSSVYNAKSYNVYRDGNLISSTANLTYGDSGLSPGTTYTYSIGAANELGESPLKTVSFTTVPSVPSGLTAVGGQNKVSLSWNSVPGASYYVVKRNGVIVYKGSDTSYVNSNLPNNTSYNFTIQAGNNGGLSAVSTYVTAKTLLPMASVLNVSVDSVYTAGQSVYMTVSLKDTNGNVVPNETIAIKITYPNSTYRTYSYKTDVNGNINLVMYTNVYTLRGTYKINASKTASSYDPYDATSTSASFVLQ